MTLDIRIDRETCAGTANCQFWAGATFDLDEDNKAVVEDAEGDPEDAIIRAAEGCPTASIEVWRGDERLV